MQYKRCLSTLQNFSFMITAIATCLMLGFSVSAETVNLRDTLSFSEKAKMQELWDMGALHDENLPVFIERLKKESIDDPDRLSKAMKGDFTNRARRELRHIHVFIQDPRVGLPQEHWFLIGLIPIAIVCVIWHQNRHSITKGSTV